MKNWIRFTEFSWIRKLLLGYYCSRCILWIQRASILQFLEEEKAHSLSLILHCICFSYKGPPMVLTPLVYIYKDLQCSTVQKKKMVVLSQCQWESSSGTPSRTILMVVSHSAYGDVGISHILTKFWWYHSLIFGWSYVEPEVGQDGPYRSPPTWDILWFCDHFCDWLIHGC